MGPDNDQPTFGLKESKTLIDVEKIGSEPKNQTNDITINKIFRKVFIHCKTGLSADFGSDQHLVMCNFKVKLHKLKRTKSAPKSEYDRLLNDPNCKKMYTDSIKIS